VARGDITLAPATDAWQEVREQVDLEQLAEDLAQLRRELRSTADAAEHREEISAVDDAEVALGDGDGATVVERLRTAGEWVLQQATNLGALAAVAALRRALGL
jgi:hypothetical protein